MRHVNIAARNRQFVQRTCTHRHLSVQFHPFSFAAHKIRLYDKRSCDTLNAGTGEPYIVYWFYLGE